MKAKFACMFALLLAVLVYPILVNAQKVVLVYGPVTDPVTIKEKQTLKPGQAISVPAGSLVIVEYKGPSDLEGYPCVHWQYIKGEANDKVSATKPNGECPVERNPSNCKSPECMQSGQLYFYEGGGKGDGRDDPPKVKDSTRYRNELGRGLAKLRRNSSVSRQP